jgi:Arc/MetJ-type ribon-helix-helix transcriptional regulator
MAKWRNGFADSEKITINLGHVDLGRTDLMVQEGFYSNRSDFIRTAIRNQLERHVDAVQQATVRKKVELGLRHFGRADLEEARATGQTLHIRVLGLVSIANDVTAELARATIGSIVVFGALHASSVVKPLWRTAFDAASSAAWIANTQCHSVAFLFSVPNTV